MCRRARGEEHRDGARRGVVKHEYGVRRSVVEYEDGIRRNAAEHEMRSAKLVLVEVLPNTRQGEAPRWCAKC